MKPIFRAAGALFPLLLAGCAPKTGDDRAALQKQAAQEVARAGKSAAQNAGKSLAGAKISGGQIQIGDAQGRPLYRIEAKEIRAISDAASSGVQGALALGARATLFKNGTAESSFGADSIRVFNTSNGARLEMTGHVVASSRSVAGAPVEVQAPRADVDVGKRLIVASGGTVSKRGQITLKSPVLRGQSSLQTLSCDDGLITAPGAQIQAKSALFNWKTNHLSAQTVSLTRPDLLLSGAKLEADTLASRGTLSGGVSAKGPNGTARGPRLDFNWKADRLFVPDATLQSQNGTARIASLTTDSKLRVTDAQSVRIAQNGATLTAKTARGFDKLSRLSASGVVLVRDDLRVEAAQMQARDWSNRSGVIVGSGGVVAHTKSGTVNAQSAMWTGDAQTGRVSAKGNVVIRGAQGTLRGQNAQSDAHFQNAELSGSVSGVLRDGTQLSALQVQKRGDSYVASGEASARLPGGARFRANRVEGSGQNAVATGGASGTLADGTRFRASRVEKRGDLIVATGGASGQLPNGALLSASRVEKRGNVIVATGGASGRLVDGTILRASRVEKRGDFIVASGGASATLPARRGFGRVEVRAARVEGSSKNAPVRASGGVIVTAQSGAVIRAPHAVYDPRTGKVTATGGVHVKDPARGILTGDSVVADLNSKQITVSGVRGQGQVGVLSGKGLF